jgi:hypothetical protein
VGVGDGVAPARPAQHRQVVGHVPERPHVGRVDAEPVAPAGERDVLRHPGRQQLGQARRAREVQVRAAGDGTADLGEERVLRGIVDATALHHAEALGPGPRAHGQQLRDRAAVGQRRLDRCRARPRWQARLAVREPRVEDRPVGALGRQRDTGHGGAQVGEQPTDRGTGEPAYLQSASLGEVPHGRPAQADDPAVAADAVRQRVEPARRPGRDEHDLDAGLLRGGQRAPRARRHGAVRAQQRAVEVGRDEPGERHR